MDTISEEQKNEGDFEYLSEDGFKRLKKELEHLRTGKRQEIAKRLEYAKSLGDLSENAEYTEAKTMQENNEARVAELEDTLSRTVLIKKTATVATVTIGSTVRVKQKQGSSDLEEYTVVGSEEADPLARRISNESPLGQAVLGRKKGEVISVSTPRGAIDYIIAEII